MRQYQEDVENLNEVAHNRPRAQLVLGIQQENRHIRTLQQENKELRAALEEHQNALELIMSKYRQHVTRLVNTPHPDINTINNQKIQMLADRTEKVCEMAAVMKEAVRVDEDTCNQQQELMARLITENKGLRELLEISQKNNSSPRVKKVVTNVNKEVQTDNVCTVVEQVVSVTLPMPTQPRPPPRSPKVEAERKQVKVEPSEPIEQVDSLECGIGELSSGDSDETGSEDESVKYDTIKLADRRNKEAAKEKVRSTYTSDKEAAKEEVKIIETSDKEVTKEIVKTTSTSEVSEICTEAKTEVKSEIKSTTTAAVVEAVVEAVAIEASSPSVDKQSTDSMNDTAKPTLVKSSAVEPDSPVQSLPSPPPSVLTEGEQNVVLVDSLVEQLVKDSVETSNESNTATPDTKSGPSDPADNTTTTKTASDTESVVVVVNEPNKPEQGTGAQEETSTPTSTSSSQPAAKNTAGAKAESSHSRSNSKGKNKKNDNKGNKNSPKKGNKK